MSTVINTAEDKPADKEFSGHDVNYYLVPVPAPKRLAPYTAECEDIIEALGMTFAEGCAFKAIWRSCAARTLGLGKKGQDEAGVYDAQKVHYYGGRMLAQRQKQSSSFTGKGAEEGSKAARQVYPSIPGINTNALLG